ncbi:hypothetical protein [Streptomyces sp. G45]|uniref:hypothetical protein n=1 Tax=Streptomyces sp. G45 TaxID=3406627 RepID=UPI003C1E36B1
MRSGTSGFCCTAELGSGRGTCGTDTRPAPSLPRADAPLDAPELRTDTDRDEARPDTDRDRRPDTERREDCERDERDERELAREERELADPEPRPPRPPPVMPVAGEASRPCGETTGASPQVSQYSSPPPTSS